MYGYSQCVNVCHSVRKYMHAHILICLLRCHTAQNRLLQIKSDLSIYPSRSPTIWLIHVTLSLEKKVKCYSVHKCQYFQRVHHIHTLRQIKCDIQIMPVLYTSPVSIYSRGLNPVAIAHIIACILLQMWLYIIDIDSTFHNNYCRM